MEEKDIRELSDDANETVTGGGILTQYSNNDYREAGLEVIDPGVFTNGGYILRASGQSLTEEQANNVVRFFREVGRPASNYEEVVEKLHL